MKGECNSVWKATQHPGFNLVQPAMYTYSCSAQKSCLGSIGGFWIFVPKDIAGWRCTCKDPPTVQCMLTQSNLYHTPVSWECAWDVPGSEVAVPMNISIYRRNTPFLCCLNKHPFLTYVGKSKLYKMKGLYAGYCTYHCMYLDIPNLN